MADPRFFNKSKSYKISELIKEIPCAITVQQEEALDRVLDDVAPLHTAQANQLSFLDNVKYKHDFMNTLAGACFVSPEAAEYAPKSCVCLITSTPYKAYALAAQSFYPKPKPHAAISDTAEIHPNANIGKNTSIGHHVVIEENVSVGDNSSIGHNTTISAGSRIGNDCTIDSNVTISHANIGDHVRIYPGARIGQDGFGFAIDPAGHVKVPQLGRVIIEDHVEIGANTTIDRGAGPDTIIGQGTWIDNLVQIGHNVEIGKGCIIVAQVGISGSTKVKDFVAIGGQAGIAGHLNIGAGAKIGAQSGVIGNIPEQSEFLGTPAVPKTQFFRQVATLNRLIKRRKKD